MYIIPLRFSPRPRCQFGLVERLDEAGLVSDGGKRAVQAGDRLKARRFPTYQRDKDHQREANGCVSSVSHETILRPQGAGRNTADG